MGPWLLIRDSILLVSSNACWCVTLLVDNYVVMLADTWQSLLICDSVCWYVTVLVDMTVTILADTWQCLLICDNAWYVCQLLVCDSVCWHICGSTCWHVKAFADMWRCLLICDMQSVCLLTRYWTRDTEVTWCTAALNDRNETVKLACHVIYSLFSVLHDFFTRKNCG